jgi:hypothetical protein
MASANRGAQAFALALLFVLSGPMSQFFVADHAPKTLDESVFKNSNTGTITEVVINGAGQNGVGPSLELDQNDALQTISFSVAAGDSISATGFNWSNWGQSGFSSPGLMEDDDGALILGFQGVNWNFDKGNNGWTSSNSNFGQHNSAITCGMNGATGASWWTRGGAVTVTSPQINLAGHQGLAVQAWLKQGNYQCGEEPDTNENFYLEYKTSSNAWSQIQYLPGSTTGGSVTNVNYNLPSDAYHSSFQIRARQNSGSGTCCDYWFFDDVIIPGTSGANLSTRSFGWSPSANEQIDEGRYAPILLDAIIPQDAHLNWTVIDADTNNPIPGLINRSGEWIDLSVVDWESHKSLRLNLEFVSNQSGSSPRLYGISGGGRIYDDFNNNPENDGWTFVNSSWDSSNLELDGSLNATILTPEFDIDMPFSSYKFNSQMQGDVTTYVSVDRGNWSQINASNIRMDLPTPASVIQFRFQGMIETWSVENLLLQLYPSSSIISPTLDIDNDGRPEWSVSGSGIGTWGNQDVLMDGNSSSIFEVGLNPTTWHSVLIPRDAKSFEISADNIGTVGLGVQTMALWIGNQMITQNGGNGYVDGLRLSLNASEIEILNIETSNKPFVKQVGGTDFVHGRVELISDAGTHRLAGLTVMYEANDTVSATAIDEIVLAMNRARLDANKASSLPFIFTAESACILEVSIISATSSGDVTMGALSWTNESQTLTPSQKWRQVNTRAQVHEASPNRLILNLYSDDHTAMWFIPIFGGNIISTGDHDTLVFSDGGISHNSSQDIHDILLDFRTAQSFDDQSNLRLETRIQLTNGVVSMPAIEYWANPAIDNDIQIESMSIFTDRGIIPTAIEYLKAEDNMTFNIDIGFENGDADDKPFPGEYELSLYRNGELIANTSDYEGDYWIVKTKAPFTSGNVSYEAIITPTSGGGLGDQTVVNRTFVIDPLAPVVTGANIRYFDHLQPSTNQEISINITDQPVLPNDVTLMLWTEWANDYNGDGWPNVDEFIPRTMTNPSDFSHTYGTYTSIIDDTAAFPGEKVAGYVIGSDPSGHVMLGGGSEMVDDHLFMYQIMNDGVPAIDSDGFEWTSGRKAWLHPGQTYGLNVSFTELNGISDIEEIEISLADNIASDKLSLRWNSQTRQCSSDTIHIVISMCKLNDQLGLTPSPYDQDLVLYLEIVPQWTLPDLGDTRREPIVTISDRAGNTDIANFPQNRWRFSAEMMVTNEVSLWVENGALTEEGARVSPGSSMELSGDLIFVRSLEVPQFDCEVEVRLNGIKEPTTAIDGSFTAYLNAPVTSGQHAMTWNIDCMPEQGVDLTSPTEAVKWVLVDAVGPQVIEFSSPRETSILEAQTHFVKVIISENYGIDTESVEIIWWVTAKGSNNAISSGNAVMELEGNETSGLRLEFTGSIDLSVISPEFLQEQVVLKIRFEGRDIAGNQFESLDNNENNPAGIWDLVHHKPDILLDTNSIELSKSNLEVDEPTIVQIHVRNDGKLGGEAEVIVEVVDLNGDRTELTKTSIFVESESVSTVIVDWKPELPGIQRIEVTLVDQTETSDFIDVKPIQERSFLQDTIGSTNPWILGTTLTMICVGLLFILSWMRFATVKQSESEWESEEEMEIED